MGNGHILCTIAEFLNMNPQTEGTVMIHSQYNIQYCNNQGSLTDYYIYLEHQGNNKYKMYFNHKPLCTHENDDRDYNLHFVKSEKESPKLKLEKVDQWLIEKASDGYYTVSNLKVRGKLMLGELEIFGQSYTKQRGWMGLWETKVPIHERERGAYVLVNTGTVDMEDKVKWSFEKRMN